MPIDEIKDEAPTSGPDFQRAVEALDAAGIPDTHYAQS